MSNPPSFEPRRRRPRPSANGAQQVGRGAPSNGHGTPSNGHGAPSNGHAGQFEGAGQEIPASIPPRQQRARSQAAYPANQPAAYPPGPRPPRSANQRAEYPQAYGSANAHSPAPLIKRRRRPRIGRIILTLVLILLVAIPGWGFYLYHYGDSKLDRVAALSETPATAGTTYLIVGSDKRDSAVVDGTEGARADTIMLLQKPESGPAALVSLPRDTLVTYADSDAMGKLNGAYSYGGPQYLVQTVEQLTGLTIDHYIEIGMEGVTKLTDAVGGVELCLDYDVDDEYSGLKWQAGCANADGTTALAFSRMRYSDPLGDIGRAQRQRQVVGKILNKALAPSTLINPIRQRQLMGAGASVLTVDDDSSLLDVARAGLALRSVMAPGGLSGAPPIAELNHRGPGGSSTVLLADEADQFWADLRDGNLTADSFASFQ